MFHFAVDDYDVIVVVVAESDNLVVQAFGTIDLQQVVVDNNSVAQADVDKKCNPDTNSDFPCCNFGYIAAVHKNNSADIVELDSSDDIAVAL